ncbi:MAG: hypothetical protein AAGA48_27725 [Myxococcota bacterium]
MRIISMTTLVALMGCEVETPPSVLTIGGFKRPVACEPLRDATDEPMLITSCISEDCSLLSVTLEPNPGPASWSFDGTEVADAACGIEVSLEPGRSHTLTAKWAAGTYATQQMRAMNTFPGEEGGEPEPEIVIYGNGEGCDLYWITMLGGCLKAPDIAFERRLFAMSNQTNQPDATDTFEFSPRPAPATVDRVGYADFGHWTVAPPGRFPAGPPPALSLNAGSNPYLSHGFGLPNSTRGEIYIFHGRAHNEYLDTFWCVDNKGGFGNLPPGN